MTRRDSICFAFIEWGELISARTDFPTEVEGGGGKFCEAEILGEGQVSAFGQEQTLKLLYFYADPIP